MTTIPEPKVSHSAVRTNDRATCLITHAVGTGPTIMPGGTR